MQTNKKYSIHAKIILAFIIFIGFITAATVILKNNPNTNSTLVYVAAESTNTPLILDPTSADSYAISKIYTAAHTLQSHNQQQSTIPDNCHTYKTEVQEGDFYLAGEFKKDEYNNALITVAYPAPNIIEHSNQTTPDNRYQKTINESEKQSFCQTNLAMRGQHYALALQTVSTKHESTSYPTTEITHVDASHGVDTTQDFTNYLNSAHIVSAFSKEPLQHSTTTLSNNTTAPFTSGIVQTHIHDTTPNILADELDTEQATLYSSFFGTPNYNNQAPPTHQSLQQPHTLQTNQYLNGSSQQLLQQQSNNTTIPNDPFSSIQDISPTLASCLSYTLGKNYAESIQNIPTIQELTRHNQLLLNDDTLRLIALDSTKKITCPANNQALLQVPEKTPEKPPINFIAPPCKLTLQEMANLEKRSQERINQILSQHQTAHVRFFQPADAPLGIGVQTNWPIRCEAIIDFTPQQPRTIDYAIALERQHLLIRTFGYLDFLALAMYGKPFDPQALTKHLILRQSNEPNIYVNYLFETLNRIRQSPADIAYLMGLVDFYQYPGFIALLHQFPDEYATHLAKLEQEFKSGNKALYANVRGLERKFGHPCGWLAFFPIIKRNIYDHRDVYPFRELIKQQADYFRYKEEPNIRKALELILHEAEMRPAINYNQELNNQCNNDLDSDPEEPEKIIPPYILPHELVALEQLKELALTALDNNQEISLASCALDWITQAENANKYGDTQTFNRSYARAKGVLATISNDTPYNKQYPKTPLLTTYASNVNLPTQTLYTLHGTPFQHTLHQESLDALEHNLELHKQCKNAFNLNNSLNVAHSLNFLALEHLQDGNVLHACQLLDISHSLVNTCNTYIQQYGAVADMTHTAAQFICDVANRAKGVLHERLPDMIKDIPVQALCGVAFANVNMLIPGFTAAKLILGCSVLSYQAGKYCINYYNLLKKDPIEANAQLSADFIQLLTTGGISSIATRHGSAYAHHIQKIIATFAQEEAIATAAAAFSSSSPAMAAVVRQHRPLSTMLRETKYLVGKAHKLYQHDPEAGKNFMTSINHHLQKMQEPGADQWLYFKNFPKNRTKLTAAIDQSHIYEGIKGFKYKTNELKIDGYHSKIKNKYPIIKRINGPNKFGNYKETYSFAELKKDSTFFPDSWNKTMISKKIYEAGRFENRVFIEERGFVGKTKEGMLIQFWYDPLQDNAIRSVYPYVEEQLEPIIKMKLNMKKK